MVGKQAQRPAPLPAGRCIAGSGEEPRLPATIARGGVGCRCGARHEGSGEPLLNEALSDALTGAHADVDRSRDGSVEGSRLVRRRIGLEQDAGVGQFPGRRCAGRDEAVAVVALGWSKADAEAFCSHVQRLPDACHNHQSAADRPLARRSKLTYEDIWSNDLHLRT